MTTKNKITQKKTEEVRHHSRILVRELDLLKGVYRDSGCTLSQCHTLFELDKHRMLNLGELSTMLRMDKSNTSRVIKSLSEEGLIQISQNNKDLRQKIFSLTDKGMEKTKQNNQLANEQVDLALSLLDEDEIALITQGLKLYAKVLHQSRLQSAYTLRLIEEKDNLQVTKLIKAVMQEFNISGEGYSITDEELNDMFASYQNDRSVFYVITDQDKILGCGGIGPLKGGSEDTCELKKMYLYQEIRGMGFGKILVKKCLESAQNLGYRRCYLETVDRMWKANNLYQKMGFKKLDCSLGNTGHHKCEAFYVKSFAP